MHVKGASSLLCACTDGQGERTALPEDQDCQTLLCLGYHLENNEKIKS